MSKISVLGAFLGNGALVDPVLPSRFFLTFMVIYNYGVIFGENLDPIRY